ncbi:hypothetical protein [Bradyrhizobium sp. AZCC 2289]|uniref:hypothetical protein n=1 Tax=Bradyrhizobium sp. AZCC 2289 TaxID=3117026 RepID=UPI002FF1868A
MTLTPHHVAMTRAGDAANRIEQHMHFLRRTGELREFTGMYKQRRMAAAAQGQGFMTYQVAEARLRRALIPLLVGGHAAPMQITVRAYFRSIWRGNERGSQLRRPYHMRISALGRRTTG